MNAIVGLPQHRPRVHLLTGFERVAVRVTASVFVVAGLYLMFSHIMERFDA